MSFAGEGEGIWMRSQMLLLTMLFLPEDPGGEAHSIVSPSSLGSCRFLSFVIVPCFFDAVTSLQCSHLMYLTGQLQGILSSSRLVNDSAKTTQTRSGDGRRLAGWRTRPAPSHRFLMSSWEGGVS